MTRTASAPSRRGMSLVEAMMSALVVAVIFAGALHAVGASGASRARAAARATGALLADALVGEILSRAYSADPENDAGGLKIIGIGGLEVTLGGGGLVEIEEGEGGGVVKGGGGAQASPIRALFTTVDDYHGLVDAPPTEVDGTPIPGLTGWCREVVVELVSPNDGATVVMSDAGVKRITVTVKRAGGVFETRRFLVADVP